MIRIPYRAALRAVAGRSAVPYGYTVTLWSSGALLMHARGTPDVGDVFLFVAGAVGAFAVLGAIVRSTASDVIAPSTADLVITGTLNVVAVGAAVGAVGLIALIATTADWAFASFTATAVYLGGSALQLAWVHTGSARVPADRTGADHHPSPDRDVG